MLEIGPQIEADRTLVEHHFDSQVIGIEPGRRGQTDELTDDHRCDRVVDLDAWEVAMVREIRSPVSCCIGLSIHSCSP